MTKNTVLSESEQINIRQDHNIDIMLEETERRNSRGDNAQEYVASR